MFNGNETNFSVALRLDETVTVDVTKSAHDDSRTQRQFRVTSGAILRGVGARVVRSRRSEDASNQHTAS